MPRPVAVLALLVGATACKEKPAESPPPPVTKPEPPVPPSREIRSPLPEKGPHPDYPTPVAAGTDKIFLLEEPDRGPLAPRELALPARASLAWKTYAFCDLGELAPACAGSRGAQLRAWRVGSEGGAPVVVEELRGDTIVETTVYEREGATPKRRVTLDRAGRVRAALLFASPTRYSHRERTGRNGLPGCGAIELELDPDRGQVTASRCLQWSGEPMHDTSGVARTTYKRDARGFVVEAAFWGVDGKPVVDVTGVHGVRHERDAAGWIVATSYLDVAGKPTARSTGCHADRIRYDDRHLVTRTACLGPDGKESNRRGGWSAQDFTYDARGCRTSMRFRAAPGSTAPLGHGADFVVDEACQVTSHTCVDPAGNRQICSTGEPARYDYAFDAFGRTISTKHYAPDGRPARDPVWGAFETRVEYDDLGNVTAQACFDEAARPVLCGSLGFHRQQSQVDDVGREVERTFFDERGKPGKNIGASMRRFRYDNYDHLFEGKGLDATGKVVETFGMATRRDLYDARHQLFGIVLLDAAERPARYTGCFAGVTCPRQWHAVRLVRAPDGETTQNQFFDHDGQLVATVDCTKSRCFK